MAATSGHVSIIIEAGHCVQYRHQSAASEARKNQFLFRFFSRFAFRSEPNHRRQLAGVSISNTELYGLYIIGPTAVLQSEHTHRRRSRRAFL